MGSKQIFNGPLMIAIILNLLVVCTGEPTKETFISLTVLALAVFINALFGD